MRHYLGFILLFSSSCVVAQKQGSNYCQYVKPLAGTDRMGHTFPGAVVPFGSVQLSPETDTLPYEVNGKYNKDVYKYCAGYQYTDKTIVGFTHTHFSGTGHSDLGDFLIMPTTGPLKLNPGTADRPQDGYRSGYTHKTEVATPNYYKVELDKYNILAELTATNRVGFHQYTFAKNEDAHIILDMVYGIYNYPDKNVWSFIRIENDTLVTGYRQTNGWGRTRTVYFAMSFNQPIRHYGIQNSSKKEVYRGFWGKFNQAEDFPEGAGQQLKAWFDFNVRANTAIKVKFAISPVSTANAVENMIIEVPGWDFEKVHKAGVASWERELSKIEVKSKDLEVMQNFYTSMYHAFIHPNTYMDVNHEYRGLDQNTHRAEGFINYTTFSLWDTYRALHPLFNLIQPERNADMVNSMLAHYDQSVHHMLPVWSNSANENWCMIGYHSVSVIADAVLHDLKGIDYERAFKACIATANNRKFDGLGYYLDYGYVPEDKSGSSVSKTLEFAYDDYCISMMALKLGKVQMFSDYLARSANYKHVFDSASGFMRPRMSDGSFKKHFDVLNTDEPGFVEGNAWNYSLYVPQSPNHLVDMMGGKDRFGKYLDSLFTMQLPDSFFANTEDITRDGIIGGYVHGNEPSHHIAYLYYWTNEPWKTQSTVRMIMNKMYHPTPSGLSGNDDCGQMSAWYVFSALGFYPVAPTEGSYLFGSPLVDEATIHLSANDLHIKAINQSKDNVYVKKITLNGMELNKGSIKYEDMAKGGELVFYMGGGR